jgi:DNA repair exonuclease SbcCD ATPase subunit
VSTGGPSRRVPRRGNGRVPRPKKHRRLKPGPQEAFLQRLLGPGGVEVRPETSEQPASGILPWSGRPGGELDGPPRPRPAHEPPVASLTPEQKELRRKSAQLAAFEDELARQELRLANLRAEMLPFEERYYLRIGARCAKLDQLEAEIAEIEARLHREDAAAQEWARRARGRAEESREALRRKMFKPGAKPPAALKRLYHAVARRVHPDFGEDPSDRDLRERLMAHANRAYQRCDERRLRAIVSEYEFAPEMVRGEGTPLELVRVIRKIAVVRGRLGEIDEEMQRTRSSDLFRFKARVESGAKEGRDLFAEVLAAVNARIAKARRKRNHLISAAKSAEAGAPAIESERPESVPAPGFARGCAAE